MKRLEILAAVGAFVLTMGSCGGNGGRQQADNSNDSMTVIDLYRDSTLYGVCTDGSAMNTLQMVLDTGDTITVDITAAQESGQVFGGYATGDRMAIMPSPDRLTARLVINLSTLLGDWVMPNPLDGSDEMGISIKEGGIAESIQQSSVNYRTWRIYNGRLEIEAIREGGGDLEEIYLYDILCLGPDTLAYKVHTTNRDEEETFEYGRQKENKGYGVDIKLEDASTEDFRI